MVLRHRGVVRPLSPTLGLICRDEAGTVGSDAVQQALAVLAAAAEDRAVRSWIAELREVMARQEATRGVAGGDEPGGSV